MTARATLAVWLASSACAANGSAPASLSLVRSAEPFTAHPATSASANPVRAPEASAARPCGALGCLAFQSAEAAFAFVLQSAPRVLAVGEAHAQEGLPGVRSSTRRFAEQLLPSLAGKSQHIVIELLAVNCKRTTLTGLQKQQAPITEHQAKSNQNEFLTLGKYAQHLGIEPQALSPDCAEYESVLAAREDSVARLLGLVADTTAKAVDALLAQPGGADQIIVTYGGALHNDLLPRPGQEAWSFGPKLAKDSLGRYVELDLIVPEYVKDNDAWRGLPWFAAFDRTHLSDEAILYRPTPGSFALIFPQTRAMPSRGL